MVETSNNFNPGEAESHLRQPGKLGSVGRELAKKSSGSMITSEKEPVVSGEISSKYELGKNEVKKEDKPKFDRILEAYEEADTTHNFTKWMLENSDIALTRESVESAPAIEEYLKSNFKEQKSGLEYKDFLDALPTAQEYIDKARGR